MPFCNIDPFSQSNQSTVFRRALFIKNPIRNLLTTSTMNQQPTIFDTINRLQQQLDLIDVNIAYKKEILCRGVVGDFNLQSGIRKDLEELEKERKNLSDHILKLKTIPI